LLDSVPLGVVTVTVPVVAPTGTVVSMAELEPLNVAAVPLKLTLVAPPKFVPRIMTRAPTLPKVGCSATKGPSPVAKLKIVPSPLAPPAEVVP